MENEFCLLCSGKNLNALPSYKAAHLVRCATCGFVFSKKIPSNEELTKYYTNYPRFDELSPITIKRYNELLDKFEDFKKTNNILDVGCSNGLFLECAKKRGWNVYGTEFAEESIITCANKNIKVFKSDKLPPDFFNLQFDVITSFEVIEHINNPNEEIELIKKVLRKGGAFYVTTPNFNSISRFLLKEKWNVIDFPEHLSYYTSKTINTLLQKHGFEKLYVLTTGISLSRFNQSLNAETRLDVKPGTDEDLRGKIEKNTALQIIKKTFNFFLNLFKIGDALKAFYIYK